MNSFEIDAFDFCRKGESRQGSIPVESLARLATELLDKNGIVHWQLQGGKNASGYPQLKLNVKGTVTLLCQRCLSGLQFEIDTDSTLIIAKDESSADEIDALLEDDAIDVIVGSSTMNVLELVEDDALLALPQAPRHVDCAPKHVLNEAEGDKPSPFSVLKNFKQ